MLSKEVNASNALVRAVHFHLARYVEEHTPQHVINQELTALIENWKQKFPEVYREDYKVGIRYIPPSNMLKVEYSGPLLELIDNAREEIARAWDSTPE